MKLPPKITKLITKAKKDKDILAVLLFGSKARNENNKNSDIDICLVLNQGKYSILTLSRKKIEYLKLFTLDIHIFQQMPIYIKDRIIRDAKVLFCSDEKALYEVYFKTIGEVDKFKNVYQDYLQEVASGR